MRRRLFALVIASTAAATLIAANSPATAVPDAAKAVGAASPNSGGPSDRGAALARAHGPSLGLTADQGLRAKDVVVDRSGAEHVRFDRTFKTLPVIGGDLVIHSDGKGSYGGADGRKKDVAVPSVTPGVSAQSAAVTATSAAAFSSVTRSTPKLAVYALDGAPRLVWQTQVDGKGAHGEPAGEVVFVDARTGSVVNHWPTVISEVGTGNSLYLGSVSLTTALTAGQFQMVDQTRGGARTEDANNGSPFSKVGTLLTDTDNLWGDGAISNRQSAAVDASFGAAATWDFYKNSLGRNGIRNNGVGAKTLVHVGTNWVNATWNEVCFCMSYGDGDGLSYGPLVSLDITGHEMTHGVTSSTANLIYAGESGALNEATSDVMGTMVEFKANQVGDPGDYLIGERVALAGTAPLRYMDRPSKDGLSADCWRRGVGSLDVHYSSGVGNHLFYLLAEGSGSKTINGVSYLSPTCNGSKVTGIGRDKAAAIWYRALTTKWVSTTNYAGARAGMLSAAAALYGGSNSLEYRATAKAWSAVGVR